MNPYQLNEVVIEVFKESEMSQLEFSKKYNLNYSTLNHILNKETNPIITVINETENNIVYDENLGSIIL